MKPFRNSLTICLHGVLRGTDRCDSIVDPRRYKVCPCRYSNLESGLRLEGLGRALHVCQSLGSESGKCLTGLLSTTFLRTWCLPPAALPVWCLSASSCCEGTSFMVPGPDAAMTTGVLLLDAFVVELRLAGKTESLSHQYAGWPSWSVKKFLKIPPEHVFIFIFYCFWRDKYSKSLMPEKKLL